MQGFVELSVNDKAIQKRLSKIATDIEKQGKATTEQIGAETRDNIIRFMPKDTGQSRNSIGYTITTSAKGYTGVKVGIVPGREPHLDTARWHGVWFNLPWYMFEGVNAESHFRTGNVSAMRAVPMYMAQKYKRKIEVDVSNILKRK